MNCLAVIPVSSFGRVADRWAGGQEFKTCMGHNFPLDCDDLEEHGSSVVIAVWSRPVYWYLHHSRWAIQYGLQYGMVLSKIKKKHIRLGSQKKKLSTYSVAQFDAQPASVAQLDAPSDWRPGGCGFNPRWGRQHSFVEIDHEIFSMVILSLPLIQEGQLSVSGERMCTILVNCLAD